MALAFLPCAGAQEGICPDYYGPFEPDLTGNESCQNMMPPGVFYIQWAHEMNGSDWIWLEWNQTELKPDMWYVLAYNETGELSIEEYEDTSQEGYTQICCRNTGPDAIVFCLTPVRALGDASQGMMGPEGQQMGPPEGGPQMGPPEGGPQMGSPEGEQQMAPPESEEGSSY